MEKRIIAAFLSLVTGIALLVFRIADISASTQSDVSARVSSRSIAVASSRGMLYDRNMQPLVNGESRKALVINPTEDALELLEEQLAPQDFAAVSRQAEKGSPFVYICDDYEVSHKDIICTEIFERYYNDDTAVNIIGYTDSDGSGVCAAEYGFDDILTQHSGSISVRYSASASGQAIAGKGFEIINDNYASPGGVMLTIDAGIQGICSRALERNGIEKGSALVLNTEDASILAMATAPCYDRNNLEEALSDENSPFIDRNLYSYAVGSVFKPVVAIAALEEGFDEDTLYECTGMTDVSGVCFNCHKKTGHGMLNMSRAMAVSCNSYFIKLGQLVGARPVTETAERLGFGRPVSLFRGLESVSGHLPSVQEIDSCPALANLSFGQGSITATPLQIGAMYCTIANDGVYAEPYLVKKIIDGNGNESAVYINETQRNVISSVTCGKIREMLEKTVSEGSGKNASPMFCNACGKTATAETGVYSDGEKTVNTWFAGYFPSDKPEYVIVVFCEDGYSPSSDCIPVFRDIADGIGE